MLLSDVLDVPREVALFTGAWIEMTTGNPFKAGGSVALFTGAWIEILEQKNLIMEVKVALFTGAWIEIANCFSPTTNNLRRALYGRVD